MMKLAYAPISIQIIFFTLLFAFIGALIMTIILPFILLAIPGLLAWMLFSDNQMRSCFPCFLCFLCIWPLICSLIPVCFFIFIIVYFFRNLFPNSKNLSRRIKEPELKFKITEETFTNLINTLKELDASYQKDYENPLWPHKCYV